MGFYIRKSIRVGFLRFNLSTSGIGVSGGVPGFRIGTGPRGNYIHAGRNGFYYRETLGSNRTRRSSRPIVTDSLSPSQQHTPAMHEIASGDVSMMTDSTSDQMLAEINGNLSKLSLSPAIGVIAIVVAWTFSPHLSPIITLVFGCLFFSLARIFDIHRKTTVLMYAFDETKDVPFKNAHAAFSSMASVGAIWHIERSGRIPTEDRKYQAGATLLVGRKLVTVQFGPPRFIRTNVPVPSLQASSRTLYFFPDAILVIVDGKAGAIRYESLSCPVQSGNFIETDTLPNDAVVIGNTWRYVNKSGGPDRRFKNNKSIPIAKYDEIHFQSSNGLNELFQVSRLGICTSVAKCIDNLANPTAVQL